jgi:hypothetical protein
VFCSLIQLRILLVCVPVSPAPVVCFLFLCQALTCQVNIFTHVWKHMADFVARVGFAALRSYADSYVPADKMGKLPTVSAVAPLRNAWHLSTQLRSSCVHAACLWGCCNRKTLSYAMFTCLMLSAFTAGVHRQGHVQGAGGCGCRSTKPLISPEQIA